MTVEQSPGLVTPGQKTVDRRGKAWLTGTEGFQGQFLDPSPLDVPGDDEQAETQAVDSRQGVFAGLDWIAFSVTTPDNELDPHEFDPDDELIPDRQYIADVNELCPETPWKEEFNASIHQAVMRRREDVLRQSYQMAMVIALQCHHDDFIELPHGLPGYYKALLGPDGARIDYEPTLSNIAGRHQFKVTLPGKACGRMNQQAAQRLLTFARNNHGKATRLDVAIDDYSRVISIDDLEAAMKTPEFVTHAKAVRPIYGFRPRTGEITGQTLYVGSSSSRRKARIYDKLLEGGVKDCVRWEMEETKSAAEALMIQLTDVDPKTGKLQRDWRDTFLMRLVSYMDFREVDSHSEVEMRDRLEWYTQLVEEIRKGRIYLGEITASIERTVDWFESKIAPSLALVMAFYKGDMSRFQDTVNGGRERWKSRHKALALSIE